MRTWCIVVALFWHGADCFSWMPTAGLHKVPKNLKLEPLVTFRNQNLRKAFIRRGSNSRMATSFDGTEAVKVVEGPFEGQFGIWFVDSKDAQEVFVYRLSLLAASLSLLVGTLISLTSISTMNSLAESSLDLCAFGFLASFGISLTTIHIYMKPLHRMLQALWLGGVVGSFVAAVATPSHHLVSSTIQHPELLLASGWAFVALTGLFFKEYACFQRLEASVLFLLVPILTGGHFLGILPADVEKAMAVVSTVVITSHNILILSNILMCGQILATTFTLFSLRKFGQPLKADIGDKTIFQYMALQESSSI